MMNDGIITLRLSPEQAEQFAAVLEQQRERERATVFVVVSRSYCAATGGTAVKLEAKSVDWKAAQKALKLIRQA